MIIFILILGLILRVVNLNQSLWLDESINILAAKNNTLLDFIFVYPIGDFHPPLYFLLIWLWTHIFGFTEISSRSLSVLFGIFAVYILYLLVKDVFNKKIALVSSLLLTTSPLIIYYSQEARMYSLDVFASVFCFYGFVKLLKHQKYGLPIYIFSVGITLLSDYLLFFILFAQLIYILIWSRNVLIRFITGVFIGSIPFLLWLPVFIKQLSSGLLSASVLPVWAEIVGGANGKNIFLFFAKSYIGRVSIENDYLYVAYVLFFTFLMFYLVFSGIKFKSNYKYLFILWFFIPLTLSFIISFFIPVFAYFRLIFVLPALYILISLGIVSFKRNLITVFVVIILINNFFFLSFYYLNPKFQREDWRNAVSYIDLNKKSSDVVLVENNTDLSPLVYYYPSKRDLLFGLNKIPANTETDINTIPLKYTRIFLFEYLVDVTDPNRHLENSLKSNNFKLQNTVNFNGVGLIKIYAK